MDLVDRPSPLTIPFRYIGVNRKWDNKKRAPTDPAGALFSVRLTDQLLEAANAIQYLAT